MRSFITDAVALSATGQPLTRIPQAKKAAGLRCIGYGVCPRDSCRRKTIRKEKEMPVRSPLSRACVSLSALSCPPAVVPAHDIYPRLPQPSVSYHRISPHIWRVVVAALSHDDRSLSPLLRAKKKCTPYYCDLPRFGLKDINLSCTRVGFRSNQSLSRHL